MTYLYHLSTAEGFSLELRPLSLAQEGFVHLSTAEQVLGTANRWFASEKSLKLAVLQGSRLEELLKWEDLYHHGQEFPHYYGPLPEDSVVGMVKLERNGSGDFVWPRLLAGLRSPLLEPFSEEAGLIEPSRRFPEAKLPECCVLCFFPDVVEALGSLEGARSFHGLGSEIGASQVLTVPFRGSQVAVCHPGVGGPLAGATLEELIALGCRKFVLCGGAGSLRAEQALGQLVVVDSTVRDEGLSHHYFEPGKAFALDPETVQAVESTLAARGVPYLVGASWTTDALYRETPTRIQRRKDQGCLTVEMEIASLVAVAQYREVRFGALLYCGDDVGSEAWDFRDWTSATSVRERLFRLALEAVSRV